MLFITFFEPWMVSMQLEFIIPEVSQGVGVMESSKKSHVGKR